MCNSSKSRFITLIILLSISCVFPFDNYGNAEFVVQEIPHSKALSNAAPFRFPENLESYEQDDLRHFLEGYPWDGEQINEKELIEVFFFLYKSDFKYRPFGWLNGRYPNFFNDIVVLNKKYNEHDSSYWDKTRFILLMALPRLYESQINALINVFLDESNDTGNLLNANSSIINSDLLSGIINKKTEPESYFHFQLLISLVKNQLPELSKDVLTQYIDTLSSALSSHALNSSNFEGIFSSKLFYLIRQSILHEIGLTDQALIDTASQRLRGKLSVHLLSSKPINESTGLPNKFGFYSQEVYPSSDLEDPFIFDEEVHWTSDGRRYTSQIRIVSLDPIDHLVNRSGQADYDEIWSDNTMEGLVAIGSFSKKIVKKLTRGYKRYLLNNGFTIRLLQNTGNSVDFIRNKIRGKSLDYFIKEAHSDGDDQNLFNMNMDAQVWEARKKIDSDRVERIFLVYDDEDPYSDRRLITNEEFGRWINFRKSSGGPTLYYFNTSCSSYHKVINEYEATFKSADSITIIPSKGTAKGFVPIHTNALYGLLDGFRKQRSFKSIATGAAGKEYLFPHEDEYYNEIISYLTGPVKIEIKIFNEEGQEIDPSELHH